ncbi:hypothetical protein DFR50_12567 [Roseiarcus fermentans]|uniref:ATPase n=2 Tax=Roseiarcus fermentans TaxID=1473586 RepID=A0A366F4F2_9HYPH|nr:hypothetical protein DFR50_12567 [Roseiarcus fermentans]
MVQTLFGRIHFARRRRLTGRREFRFKTLGYSFEPEVVTFDPYSMLVWSANGPAGTSGAHPWYIEPTQNGCTVITEEAQKGLLLLILARRVRSELLASHEDWVQSLKRLAESGQSVQTL